MCGPKGSTWIGPRPTRRCSESPGSGATVEARRTSGPGPGAGGASLLRQSRRCPDLLPLAGALAATLPGRSRILGARHAAEKESDRRGDGRVGPGSGSRGGLVRHAPGHHGERDPPPPPGLRLFGSSPRGERRRRRLGHHRGEPDPPFRGRCAGPIRDCGGTSGPSAWSGGRSRERVRRLPSGLRVRFQPRTRGGGRDRRHSARAPTSTWPGSSGTSIAGARRTAPGDEAPGTGPGPSGYGLYCWFGRRRAPRSGPTSTTWTSVGPPTNPYGSRPGGHADLPARAPGR